MPNPVKLVILYRNPTNIEEFEARYARNLKLIEAMPGIRKLAAGLVIGSPDGKPGYYRVLEIFFDSKEALDSAMSSPEGAAAGRDLMSFAGELAEILFVAVYEEQT